MSFEKVGCPNCGHEMNMVMCQCDGYIRSSEAWKLGRWDWRWLSKSFGYKITGTDVDRLVEFRGQFLVFETKPPGTIPAKGQYLALKALATLDTHTVVILEGHPDDPTAMTVWGEPRRKVTMADVVDFARKWFEKAGGAEYEDRVTAAPCQPCVDGVHSYCLIVDCGCQLC